MRATRIQTTSRSTTHRRAIRRAAGLLAALVVISGCGSEAGPVARESVEVTVSTPSASTTAASTTLPLTTLAPMTAPPVTLAPVTLAPITLAPATTADETVPPTLAPETTVLVVETAPPETVPPETVPPETVPPETVPPVTIQAATTQWGGWPFYAVPRLGSEPVRGSGCGADGGLGDVIPDGIWQGQIGDRSSSMSGWSDSQLQIDVYCVHFGAKGQQLLDAACAVDEGSGGCEDQDPENYIVNASKRIRTMPVLPSVEYGVAGLGVAAQPCASPDRHDSGAPWVYMPSWIVVSGGVVTQVVTACPAG